jgi:hypothetical protein
MTGHFVSLKNRLLMAVRCSAYSSSAEWRPPFKNWGASCCRDISVLGPCVPMSTSAPSDKSQRSVNTASTSSQNVARFKHFGTTITNSNHIHEENPGILSPGILVFYPRFKWEVKWLSKKCGVMMWTGLTWLRIQTSGGFHDTRDISLLPE